MLVVYSRLCRLFANRSTSLNAAYNDISQEYTPPHKLNRTERIDRRWIDRIPSDRRRSPFCLKLRTRSSKYFNAGLEPADKKSCPPFFFFFDPFLRHIVLTHMLI